MSYSEAYVIFQGVQKSYDGETLVVKDGRYGPYISDGKVNASLNKIVVDPETITLEEATELIDEKRAKGPIKKRRKKR